MGHLLAAGPARWAPSPRAGVPAPLARHPSLRHPAACGAGTLNPGTAAQAAHGQPGPERAATSKLPIQAVVLPKYINSHSADAVTVSGTGSLPRRSTVTWPVKRMYAPSNPAIRARTRLRPRTDSIMRA
jgi:hypothetical protein